MCLPIVAAVAAGIGALASTAGTVVQGVGAANAGAAADQTSKLNSVIAQGAAADATARGTESAGMATLAGEQVVGKQRAAYAGSGVDVSNGTAADTQAETRGMARMDAETIKNNAMREAWGYKSQSADILRQGQQANAAGQQALGGSFLGAAGKLGEGVSQTYRAAQGGLSSAPTEDQSIPYYLRRPR